MSLLFEKSTFGIEFLKYGFALTLEGNAKKFLSLRKGGRKAMAGCKFCGILEKVGL